MQGTHDRSGAICSVPLNLVPQKGLRKKATSRSKRVFLASKEIAMSRASRGLSISVEEGLVLDCLISITAAGMATGQGEP